MPSLRPFNKFEGDEEMAQLIKCLLYDLNLDAQCSHDTTRVGKSDVKTAGSLKFMALPVQ